VSENFYWYAVGSGLRQYWSGLAEEFGNLFFPGASLSASSDIRQMGEKKLLENILFALNAWKMCTSSYAAVALSRDIL